MCKTAVVKTTKAKDVADFMYILENSGLILEAFV